MNHHLVTVFPRMFLYQLQVGLPWNEKHLEHIRFCRKPKASFEPVKSLGERKTLFTYINPTYLTISRFEMQNQVL